MKKFNFKDLSKKESGIFLIELILVTVVIGIITAAIGNIFINQLKSAYFVEDQLSKNSLKMELTSLLDQSLSCNATLAGTTVPAVGAPPINIDLEDSNGNVKYSTQGANPLNTYDKLTLTSIQLSNISVLAPNTSGVVEITVGIDRVRKGGGPDVLNPLKFNIQASVNAISVITQCGAIAGPGNQLAPAVIAVGGTGSCPPGSTPTGCNAEGEKSCVPNAAGTTFSCLNHGGRGSRCYLYCRQ